MVDVEATVGEDARVPQTRPLAAGRLTWWLSIAVGTLFLAATAPEARAAISEFPLGTSSSTPTGIVATPDGNLWVAQTSASRIARVTPAGVTTEFTLAAGREPFGLTVAGGLLYFTERGGDRIGRINPFAGSDAAIQATITEFTVLAGGAPTGIVAGSDGALWFTESGTDRIGRLTTAGVLTNEYAVPGAGNVPTGIAAGADGALWFTERGSSQIGRITTAGAITEFAVPGLTTQPNALEAITAGPDGALWFAAPGVDQIGRITTTGAQTRFLAADGAGIEDLVTGSDGALWFTEGRAAKIGRMTTAGAVSEFTLADRTAGPSGIAAGTDGALWFTERIANKVGSITTDTTPDAPAVGPPGPPGEPGPPGADAGLGLVAFEVTPRRPHVGRRVRVKFAITAGADVSLAVARLKGSSPAAQTVTTAAVDAAGIGKLAWDGMLRGKSAKPGRYELTVTASGTGASVTSSIRTRLRPK
jgi:virginiamycin B lyase